MCRLILINLLLPTLIIANVYNLNRTIENYGFHRRLNTKLSFKLKNNECKYLIIEKFPSNSYVDKYELAKNRINFLLNTNVDIEKAEYESEPFDLLIYPQCTCYNDNECHFNIKLPFHVRYHAPSPNGSVEFIFPDPLIYQLNNESPSKSLPCDYRSTEYCQWSPINYTKLYSQQLMKIKVPVVKDDSQIVILFVSLLVILACLVCLIKASYDKINNVIFYIHDSNGKVTKYNLFD